MRRLPSSEETLADALRAVREGLSGGLSVRRALMRAGTTSTSPLRDVARTLGAGAGLDEALREEARRAADPELGAALLVLRVHTRAGGDPLPALGAAEDRLRGRAAAARDARAMTAQARLSARAILLLTPGFLALLLLVDPSGTWAVLSRPDALVLVGLGLGLQLLGGAWIGRIVSGPRPGGLLARLSRVPVLRAVAALLDGRAGEAPLADEVIRAAGIVALVLDAGLSPLQALRLTAPIVPGPFGDGLRRAAQRMRAGERAPRVLADLDEELGDPDVRRFVALFEGEALGVPLAAALRRLAADLEGARRAAAAEHVRAVSVRVLVPLGLLILPAFVLTCLVPLLLGGLEGISL